MICREFRVPLVPADSIISSQHLNGLPGSSLFWEHVHLNVRGYALIAEAFTREISAAFRGDARFGPPQLPPIPFNRDSLAIAWIDEAYADLAMQHLTTNWPFTNVEVIPAVLPSPDAQLQNLASLVYTGRTTWGEGCFATAERFRQLGDFPRAIATYRALVDDYPYHDYAWYQLGMTYQEASDIPHAIEAYAASVEASPSYPYARINLGLLLINTGRFNEAETHFREALKNLTPSQTGEAATAWYGLAAVSANLDNLDGALRCLETSLTILPNYTAAQQLRQQILNYRASQK